MERSRSPNSFWLLVSLLALFAAGKAILYDTIDPDCFWHLRVAEQLKVDGIGPIVDHLSFESIKTPWTPYSWLAELGMKAIWDVGGFRAAILTAAILMAGFTFLIALSARQICPRNDLAIIVSLVGALYFSLPFLSFRPVAFALVGLACVTWLILRDRKLRSSSAIYWTIPITVMLANCHFFAVLIPMIFAALFLGDWIQRRPLQRNGFFLFCTTLACGCTPMLLGTIQTVLHYQLDDAAVNTGLIAECAPIWAGPGRYVTCGLLAAWLCSVLNSAASRYDGQRRTIDIGLLFWAFGFFVLVLRMSRFLPLFAPIGAATLAASLPTFSGRVLQRKPIGILVSLVLAIGAIRIGTQFPSRNTPLDLWLNRHGSDAPGYPTAAAQYVESHISSGRVVNEFSWGGYLAWRLGDNFPVFSDGRTQLYSAAFWQRAFIDPVADRTLLARSGARAAVLSHNSHRLRNALTELGWKLAYHDDRADVLLPAPALSDAH